MARSSSASAAAAWVVWVASSRRLRVCRGRVVWMWAWAEARQAPPPPPLPPPSILSTQPTPHPSSIWPSCRQRAPSPGGPGGRRLLCLREPRACDSPALHGPPAGSSERRRRRRRRSQCPGGPGRPAPAGGEGGRGRGRGAPARRHTRPTVPCRPPSRAACPLRNPTTPNGARLEIGVRLGHQGDLFASAEGRRVAGGRRIGGMDGCACWPLPPSTLPRLLLIRPPHTQQLASPSAAWLAHDSPGVTRGRWVRWWAWRGTFRAAHPAHPYQPPQCTATPHKRGDRMAWRWRQRPSARCCRRCTTGPRRPVGCGARRTSWHVCVPGAYHTP